MTESFLKGKDLERAVEAIEAAILQSSPSYDEKTFRIESRKTVVVESVRHEIDIWVEVDLGKGYRSVFIFECKNQEDKVDKNDIVVFSEKIDALQAQRGFFVARSFSRYAEAQARRDPRITLLAVVGLPVERVPVPFDLHFIGQEGTPDADVAIYVDSPGGHGELNVVDADAADAILSGQRVDFREYLSAWVDAAIDERNRTFPSGRLAEGVYDLEAQAERTFGDGELLIGEDPVDSIELQVRYKMRVIRPPLVSHYEVSTRGRALSLAPAQLDKGIEATVTFVAPEPEID